MPYKCVPIFIPYLTGQWGKFKIMNAALCLHILFWHNIFCCFSLNKNCFYYFCFSINKASNFCNNISESETGIDLMIRNYPWNLCYFSWVCTRLSDSWLQEDLQMRSYSTMDMTKINPRSYIHNIEEGFPILSAEPSLVSTGR